MTRVFISYSHVDQLYLIQLGNHLALLKREGLIEPWTDQRIHVGEEFDPAIAAALDAADLILLLISPDFMSSDYCYEKEMMRAMERHEAGSAIVVPILLRACDWKTAPFGKIKSLPTDMKPVAKWPSMDDAFYDVVKQIRADVVKVSSAKPAARDASSVEIFKSAPLEKKSLSPPSMSRSSNLSLPREFTDENRHDFTVNAFDYIRNYFDASLTELQQRNAGISTRLKALSSIAFTAIIFRDGKRLAGCYIQIGGGFSRDGITYSNNEAVESHGFNEMLSIGTDSHMLYLKATMAMGFGQSRNDVKLTEEGAAEHLWTMFISPLQR